MGKSNGEQRPFAILQVRGFDYRQKPGIFLLRVRPWYYYIYLYSHSHKVIADQIFAQLSANVLIEVNTRAGVFYQGQNMCNVTLTRKSMNNVWCSKRATCRFSEKILVIYIKLPYMYFQNSKLLADTLAFTTCSSTLLWSVGGPSVLRSFRRVWLKARIDLTFTFHVSHFSNLFFLSESYCATRNSSLQIVKIKCSLVVCRKSPGNRVPQFPSATKLNTYQPVIEGSGAVKCELGFDYLCTGKMGFETLVIGFGHVFLLLEKLGSASSFK